MANFNGELKIEGCKYSIVVLPKVTTCLLAFEVKVALKCRTQLLTKDEVVFKMILET